MKKIFILFLFLFSFFSFALDGDGDGVDDETDVCPRVYARSVSGCPTLSAEKTVDYSLNSCLLDQLNNGSWVAILQPLCNNSATCAYLTGVTGVQFCDPIFPIIFDKTGTPIIRGSVFIIGL